MLDVVGYVLLGIILTMMPGFLFSLTLYPKLSNFDFWVRMGVSLALGALVISFIGFGVARAGMLELGPFVGVDLALCVAFLVVAFFRGGFEVIGTYARGGLRYARAAPKLFRKLKLPKRAKPPTPPLEQPKEPPKEQPPEKPPEQPPQKSEGS